MDGLWGEGQLRLGLPSAYPVLIFRAFHVDFYVIKGKKLMSMNDRSSVYMLIVI